MRILARISTLVASNINALLNRAENPEYLLAQLVHDMADGLQQARRYAATAIAGERQLQRELEQNRTQAEWWETRAREALTRGHDDLARRALLRKYEHRALVDSLVIQHEEARRGSETLRTALRALEERLAEAHRKQRALMVRHLATQVRSEVARVLDRKPFAFAASMDEFERLETRLIQMDDESAVELELAYPLGQLEGEFRNLEREQTVEAELASLRAQVSPAEVKNS